MKTEFKQTEVGVIPNDWEVNQLGNLIEKFVNGGTPSTQVIEYWNGNIPWITGADILNQKVAVIRRYISKEAVKNSSTNIIEKGNLLFVSRTGVGKLAIAPFDIAISQDFTGIYVKQSELSTDYLFRYFDFIQTELKSQNQGTSIQGITRDTLSSFQIPLPPTKAEQTAIATALNDADALITQLEKLIAKKRNIKQGAMQELLRPKEGWMVKKLGEIFKFLNTANNSRVDLVKSGEIEYIHYGDIHTRWNCFLDCSNNELPFIDKIKVNGVPSLEDGDLVVADASEDYEGLGACVEIKNIGKRKIVAGLHTLLLRSDKNIIADGFKGYLRNYYGVKDTLIRLSTGVSVYGISKTNLKEVEVSIPPTVEEQTSIAQILSDMDTEIEALEKKLEKYKMIKQGMMQNLLTGKIRLV